MNTPKPDNAEAERLPAPTPPTEWTEERSREVLERQQRAIEIKGPGTIGEHRCTCQCDLCTLTCTDLPAAVREIERLRAEVHEWEESAKTPAILGPTFAEAVEENERLRSEVKDQERLDWLEEIGREASCPPQSRGAYAGKPAHKMIDFDCERDLSLRAAIDAAREPK